MEIFVMVVSYLIGSIPFSYIFSRKIKNIDIRNYGSGNVGATNASRILGKKMGIIIALLDMFKGFAAVWMSVLVLNPPDGSFIPLLAGIFVILGHDYSLFLKFTGGKGVATTIGVMLYLAPLLILLGGIIWFLLVFLTKIVSLGSMIGMLSVPIFALLLNYEITMVGFTLIYALLIIFTHRGNIKRLIRGEENKI